MVLGCKEPAASGPLQQEAFVWQRHWSDAVAAAVQDAPVPGLLVLLAEVSWAEAVPSVIWTGVDLPVLAQRGEPVGLVIRSDSFAPGGAEVVAAVVEQALARAAAAGVVIDEVHLDVDVPTGRLSDYAGWLSAARSVSGGLPLTVTSLPDWLRSGSAQAVLEQTDGHVLQVHWLRWSDQPSGPMTVLVADEAARAVERAGRLGVPFRVALPTYGYQVARDADGLVLGVVAEEGAASMPGSETVQSDPAPIAALIRTWTQARPAAMRGVVWFRLPVATDRNNWPRATLVAVMAGREPRRQLRAQAIGNGRGLYDVVVTNTGESRAALAGVEVRWEGSLVAVDVLRGGLWRASEQCGLLEPAAEVLAPGQSAAIGWVRLLDTGGLSADVMDPDAVDTAACDGVWSQPARSDPAR